MFDGLFEFVLLTLHTLLVSDNRKLWTTSTNICQVTRRAYGVRKSRRMWPQHDYAVLVAGLSPDNTYVDVSIANNVLTRCILKFSVSGAAICEGDLRTISVW